MVVVRWCVWAGGWVVSCHVVLVRVSINASRFVVFVFRHHVFGVVVVTLTCRPKPFSAISFFFSRLSARPTPKRVGKTQNRATLCPAILWSAVCVLWLCSFFLLVGIRSLCFLGCSCWLWRFSSSGWLSRFLRAGGQLRSGRRGAPLMDVVGFGSFSWFSGLVKNLTRVSCLFCPVSRGGSTKDVSAQCGALPPLRTPRIVYLFFAVVRIPHSL